MGDELDIDMSKLGEMIDTALTSDDPIIKDQLRKLLMIVALTAKPDAAIRSGPFAQMQHDIRELQDAVREMIPIVRSYRGKREFEDKYEDMMKQKIYQTASDTQIAKSQWLDQTASLDHFKEVFKHFNTKGI